ncbi:MAG: FkbM family methyltransferase, partial [Ancalomicrobiaceae bacterium]|nr:FkbM family methyltransferase [Ancalomicrobiaceae bacterium]
MTGIEDRTSSESVMPTNASEHPMFRDEYNLDSLQLITPASHDFQMYVTPRYVGHYTNSPYERATSALFSRLCTAADTVIDIGAHYGFFSLLAAATRAPAKIIAVEPVPVSCEILRLNTDVSGNGLIEVRQAAASAHSGTASFVLSAASDSCSFYEHPNAAAIGRVDVETLSIDDLLSGRPAERLLIKMDTDGHELAVLQGVAETLARSKDVRLVIEFNPKMQRAAGHDPDELLEELWRLGFETFLIDDILPRYYRVQSGVDWARLFDVGSYANLYCVRRQRALNVVLFAHNDGLHGAERSLIELVDELVADYGACCTVVSPGPGPLVDCVQKVGGATIVDSRLQQWSVLGNGNDTSVLGQRIRDGVQAVCADLLPVMEAIDPDVIYTQTMTIPWGAMSAALLDKPHVWSICEFGKLDYDIHFDEPFDEVIAEIGSGGSFILTNSNVVRRTLFPTIDATRTQTIYRHISMPAHPILPATDAFQREGAFRIALLGTLIVGKGQVEALAAVRDLTQRHHNVELLLVGHRGSPDYWSSINALIDEFGLRDRVRLIDFIEYPYPVMLAADVILVCSRNEAFGRAAAEAMVLGKALVYARSGGPIEYIEDRVCGLSYAPGNIGELVEQLEKLIESPELRAQLGAQAQRHAAIHLSREAYGGAAFALLQRLRGDRNFRPKIPRQVLRALADM